MTSALPAEFCCQPGLLPEDNSHSLSSTGLVRTSTSAVRPVGALLATLDFIWSNACNPVYQRQSDADPGAWNNGTTHHTNAAFAATNVDAGG
ncbi:hypothetical protein [Arthrobacter polaris]|uniref:hypothetical protein n=1 Tax=Arthrobacter polaris TaxID=2813727 RepID=UPI001F30C8D3|nr:hypothetical protein [Arthrobacter polaris]UIK88115.1 hypothetical protein J0916_11775 [Arthrobacter polaris]